MQNNLTSGSVFKNILSFSLPYLLSYFLQTLYGMADLFLIGRYGEVDGTTAVSIGSQVMHMLTVMIVGLAMGATVMIGQAVGAQNRAKVNRYIGNTITLFAGAAAVLTLAMLSLSKGIVRLMSTPEAAQASTEAYLRICFAGLPFIIAYNVISAIFRGMGDSKSPMYFIAAACAANIGLDILFMGPLALGPAGAALGTTLSQAFSVVLSLIVVVRRRMLPGLAAARASGSLLPVLLEQGLPALVQSTLLTALLAVGGMLPAVEYRLLALLPGLLPRVPAANRFAQVFLSLLLPLLFLIAISEDWSVPAEQQEAPAKGRRALAWAATALPCLALIAFFAGWLPAYPTAIATGSMEPEIQIGDMVVMARWGLADIQPGDVIAVERQGRTIVHRVVEVRQEAGEPLYVTQGDANNAPDEEPAAQSQVEGRMIGLVPALGRISLWFHTGG